MSTVSNMHVPVSNHLQDQSTVATIARLRDALRVSKNIIVIAGAGLSAASGGFLRCYQNPSLQLLSHFEYTGIPTFRDGGGLWRSLDATTLATPTAFAANPSLVWQFYHYRRVKQVSYITAARRTYHVIGPLTSL